MTKCNAVAYIRKMVNNRAYFPEEDIKLIGKGIKAVGDVGEEPAPPQLSELKDNLSESLRGLGHRFIVTMIS